MGGGMDDDDNNNKKQCLLTLFFVHLLKNFNPKEKILRKSEMRVMKA